MKQQNCRESIRRSLENQRGEWHEMPAISAYSLEKAYPEDTLYKLHRTDSSRFMHRPEHSLEDERGVNAVANRLSKRPSTLYRWVAKGVVRVTYEKGEMRIPKEEEGVLALLIPLADLDPERTDLKRLKQVLSILPTLVARFKQIPEEELDRKMRLTRKALSNLRLIVKLEPAESRFKKRKHAAWKWVSRMKKKGKSWREIIEVVEEQLKRMEP